MDLGDPSTTPSFLSIPSGTTRSPCGREGRTSSSESPGGHTHGSSNPTHRGTQGVTPSTLRVSDCTLRTPQDGATQNSLYPLTFVDVLVRVVRHVHFLMLLHRRRYFYYIFEVLRKMLVGLGGETPDILTPSRSTRKTF